MMTNEEKIMTETTMKGINLRIMTCEERKEGFQNGKRTWTRTNEDTAITDGTRITVEEIFDEMSVER